jgi:hypothetical protein
MGFVCGALAGTGIAMFANDRNMRVIQNLAGNGFAIDWQAPISAAIVEEAVKGVGVFAVAWLSRPLLRRPMHGNRRHQLSRQRLLLDRIQDLVVETDPR